MFEGWAAQVYTIEGETDDDAIRINYYHPCIPATRYGPPYWRLISHQLLAHALAPDELRRYALKLVTWKLWVHVTNQHWVHDADKVLHP